MFRTSTMKTSKTPTRGFTLIELLVVIAIIGILASVVLASLTDARISAQETATKQQLKNLHIAVEQLLTDTGKKPNGCPAYRTANPEVALDSNQAGLVERPTVSNNSGGCEWTAEDLAKWGGPYVDFIPKDLTGISYFYDPDYIPFRNCAEKSELPVIAAIVSRGLDRAWYSCDDIYIELY